MSKTKRLLVATVAMLLGLAVPTYAAPLDSTAKSLIPSEVEQIISLDYKIFYNSPLTLALKDQVLPDDLKQFEATLRGIGINPEVDLENVTYASFRNGHELQCVALATGSFQTKVVLQNLQGLAIQPMQYGDNYLYRTSKEKDVEVVFLDSRTVLLGRDGALKTSLDARQGRTPLVDTNRAVNDMIGNVESAPVWSVLDQQGSYRLLMSALGEKKQSQDYDELKPHLLGTQYLMTFDDGVKFDLNMWTADSATSTMLSTLLQAGMAYRKLRSNVASERALSNLKVSSDQSQLQIDFAANPRQLQSLVRADFFSFVPK